MRLDLTGSVMVMTEWGPERPHTSSVIHRRVQRVEFQLRVAEEMPQFGDLGAVLVVEVLPGAEDLHGRNAGLPDSLQPHGRQPVVRDDVSRNSVMHGRYRFYYVPGRLPPFPLEQHHAGRHRDIERGDLARHGNANQEVAVLLHLVVQSLALPAEHEAAGDGIVHLVVGAVTPLVEAVNPETVSP